jgi:nitrite reductase/ring-hydroxylating ferredoxin subunit/uncharacterized membrane protein
VGSAVRMRELPFLKPVARLEHLTVLDPVIHEVQRFVVALMKPQAVEDALHGVPAGHPVHPVLVQIPIGTWTSAVILDLLPGTARPARLLVGVGVLASSSAILTGWADWARSRPEQQRVGLVHAGSNAIGTIGFSASWLLRRLGRDRAGRVVSYAAFGLVGLGGYLGGHLAYRQAIGANHADAVLQRFPTGWWALGSLAELPEERPVSREVAGEPLFVLRRGNHVDVLADISTHLGEPLTQGFLEHGGRNGTTITTTRGSVFEVATGDVVHGPATAPAIVFETRLQGDLVEVRLSRP